VTFQPDAQNEGYRAIAKCILTAVNTPQPLLAWLDVDAVLALANGNSPDAGNTVLKCYQVDGMSKLLGLLRNCSAVANAELQT
jgi:hypothetical protein